MSRTYRRIPRKYYRKPRRNHLYKDDPWTRRASIPPDAYDDKLFNDEVYTPYKIAHKLLSLGHSKYDVAKYMSKHSKESYASCLVFVTKISEENSGY